jgi:hypothetical protein
MNITLTDQNGTYSISTISEFDTLDMYIDLLVKPILLAASFSESQLDDYFVKENEFNIVFSGWLDDEEEECVAKKAPVVKKAVAKMAG